MTDLTALRYTAEHEWIALDGDVATVGITDFAADKLGDVVFVELPGRGLRGRAPGRSSARSSRRSRSASCTRPLTGDVVEVNDAVVDDPSLVNADPYGDGLARQDPRRPSAPAELLDREAYVALTGGAE